MVALVLSTSLASSPVLYADDPHAAALRTAQDAGVPVWEVEPVRLTERIATSSALVAGLRQPSACLTAKATNSAARDLAQRAEGRIAYQQIAEAKADLDQAATMLGCLSEQAEGSLGGRLFFVRGVLAAAEQDVAGARAAFQRALSFQPTLAWDPTFPPDAKPLFDEVVAGNPARPFGVAILGPGFANTTSLAVDGRVVSASGGRLALPEGTHIVQRLDPPTTLVVDIHPGHPVAIVDPAALSDVPPMDTPEARELAQALIEHAFGEGGQVFVYTGARTWRWDGAWTELPESPASEAAERVARGRRLGATGVTLVGVGGATSLVGLGIWALHRTSDPGLEDVEDLRVRTLRAGVGSGMLDAGLLTMGVGGALFIVSVPMSRTTVAVSPASISMSGTW